MNKSQGVIAMSAGNHAQAVAFHAKNLGIKSTIKGFNAKKKITAINEDKGNISNISSELDKLNELYKSGALNKEEFEKAKAKLIEN